MVSRHRLGPQNRLRGRPSPSWTVLGCPHGLGRRRGLHGRLGCPGPFLDRPRSLLRRLPHPWRSKRFLSGLLPALLSGRFALHPSRCRAKVLRGNQVLAPARVAPVVHPGFALDVLKGVVHLHRPQRPQCLHSRAGRLHNVQLPRLRTQPPRLHDPRRRQHVGVPVALVALGMRRVDRNVGCNPEPRHNLAGKLGG